MPQSALAVVKKYYPNVSVVFDSKKDVEIEVTGRDSKSSNSKSPNSCALATACERSFDGAIVSMSVAYLIKGNEAFRYVVPARISREIVSFDRHQDFAPGNYRLLAPSDAKKMGPRRHYRKESPVDHPPAYKKTRHRTAGIRQL